MLRNGQTESIYKKCGTTSEPGGDLVSWGHERAQSFESTKRGRGAKGGLEGHGKIVLHADFWQVVLKTSLSVQELFLGKKKEKINTLFVNNWVRMTNALLWLLEYHP